jgi:tetratricopeptide (TPR) repeat protein
VYQALCVGESKHQNIQMELVCADDDLADRKPADRRERYERRELNEKASGFTALRLFLRCRLALWRARTVAQKQTARALLDELAGQRGGAREMALFLAEGYASLRDHDRALEFVRRARRADREDWRAMAPEARIHLPAGRHAEAANCAIESLALIYFQPRLHYTLAVALRHLGEESRAADCLRVAVQQAPAFAAAHEELAKILRRQRQFGEAALLMAKAAELRKQARARAASFDAHAAQSIPTFSNTLLAPSSRKATAVRFTPSRRATSTAAAHNSSGMPALPCRVCLHSSKRARSSSIVNFLSERPTITKH